MHGGLKIWRGRHLTGRGRRLGDRFGRLGESFEGFGVFSSLFHSVFFWFLYAWPCLFLFVSSLLFGSGLFVLSLACWFLFWLRLLGTVRLIQRREMGRGIHSGIEALDVSFFVYHYFNRQYFFLSLRCIYVIVFISVRIPFPINNCISLDLSLVLVCLFCLWLVDFYFGFVCWGRWGWYREERWDEGFTAESRHWMWVFLFITILIGSIFFCRWDAFTL